MKACTINKNQVNLVHIFCFFLEDYHINIRAGFNIFLIRMTLMTRDSRSKHYLGHFDEDEVPIWPCDQFSRPYIREEPFSYSTQSGSYWFEQRFFEMERRFAEFMKNIDQRLKLFYF